MSNNRLQLYLYAKTTKVSKKFVLKTEYQTAAVSADPCPLK
jgi:hypothetical protein